MKNYLVVFAIFYAVNFGAQEILWEKIYGGIHAEYLQDALPTLDYGFLIAGSTLSEKIERDKNNGDFDYFICKMDEFGDLEWTKTYGGNESDILRSIAKTNDGGYILAGESKSIISGDKITNNLGQEDIWIIKLSMSGNIIWQKNLGGFASEKVAKILPLSDGGYLVVGSSGSDIVSDFDNNNQNYILKNDNNRGALDYWIVKMDNSGNEKWQRTIGGKLDDRLINAIEINNGDILISGITDSDLGKDKIFYSKGGKDSWEIILDEEGNVKNQFVIATENKDILSNVILSYDEKLLFGGNIYKKQGKEILSNIELIKTGIDGEISWQSSYNIGNIDILTDLIINKDNSLVLCGYSISEKNNNPISKSKDGLEDYIIIKTDSIGNEYWRKFIGTPNSKEILKKAIETRDGGYVLMGSKIPNAYNDTNDSNFYIVKIGDMSKPKPKIALMEASPNPTFGETAIILGFEYDKGLCTISNMAGNVLQTKIIKENRMVPINLSLYPEGVYIISFKTDKIETGIKVIKSSHP